VVLLGTLTVSHDLELCYRQITLERSLSNPSTDSGINKTVLDSGNILPYFGCRHEPL
jgi:hypothetical protein